MTAAVRKHRVDDLVARCYLGLEAEALREEVLSRLRQLVPVDAAFFATVDPETLLFSSVLTEEPLGAASALFLDNEFGGDDVNKFSALAGGEDPVSSLDRATSGDRRSSARYTDVMAPLALGDELRVVLVSKGRCWGVMCLHRDDSPSGFTPQELNLVRRLAPHIGEGLRRALVVHGLQRAATGPGAGPGVVVLNEDLSVSSMNPQAEHWLGELDVGPPRGGAELPLPVYAAALALRRVPAQQSAPSTTIRLQTARGEWLAMYASPMSGPSGPQTSLVVEQAGPLQMASMFLDAHGLTPAQRRVAALVLQGRSTRQIVNELRISAHTVQEHLGVVFERFGVGSRRELVAALLGAA
ncbi:MAG TPA: LuxR C-terminal-related transcriptional regulator [Acidimicrobiales bacterium]|nr:LuxR C-terminal-related transcriptional regulator [Acidimicrobiales bacterium]